MSYAQYESLDSALRADLRRAVSEMVHEEIPDPDPDGDDGLVNTAYNCGPSLEEMREAADAAAAAAVEGREYDGPEPEVEFDFAFDPAVCLGGRRHEIRIGVGHEWRLAVLADDAKTWNKLDGTWLAYRFSVREARIEAADVADVVRTLASDRENHIYQGQAPEKADEVLSNAAWVEADDLLFGWGQTVPAFASLRDDFAEAIRTAVLKLYEARAAAAAPSGRTL